MTLHTHVGIAIVIMHGRRVLQNILHHSKPESVLPCQKHNRVDTEQGIRCVGDAPHLLEEEDAAQLTSLAGSS